MTHVLQKVVLPADRDPDILPLYIDAEVWSTIDEESFRMSDRAQPGNILDRWRVRVPSGRRASFGTYFNAFPRRTGSTGPRSPRSPSACGWRGRLPS